nr:hypothetical protein [Tanacetum cinerariifolium]
MRGGYLYFCSIYGPGSGLLGLLSDTRDRLMSDNEFWCIRKVKQRVVSCLQTLKRDDVQLLRKFRIQFKGDPEQVRLQLPGVPFKSSKPDFVDALDSKPKHDDQRRSNKTDN